MEELVKMTKEEKKLIKDTTRAVLENMKEVLHSDTFLCSTYLLKYLNDKDEEAYARFITIFEKL